jgi:hypothetical protein
VLRVIDPPADSCGKQQTPLAWNVQGVKGDAGAQGPAGPQGPKGEPGGPAASHFAIVDAGGTLQASNGIAGVQKVATGNFVVTFTTVVAGCAATATVRVDDTAVPSFAMTARASATQIHVLTFSPAGGPLGSPVDEGFELVVLC